MSPPASRSSTSPPARRRSPSSRRSAAPTGARTGHAGTLDPFATGLLLLLSGRATKLTPQLVGLDKRYLTEIDLRARTSTGDPEGEIVETLEPPDEAETLERRVNRAAR